MSFPDYASYRTTTSMTFPDYVSASSSSAASASAPAPAARKKVKHKRRYCKTPGCTSVIKSQGLCQRHGAFAKKCKIAGCTKQAQGNFQGMCKSHYNITPIGGQSFVHNVTSMVTLPAAPPQCHQPSVGVSVYDTALPMSVGFFKTANDDEDSRIMPLVRHLAEGAGKPPAWHRTEERMARGLPPVEASAALDDWERDLAWMEILLLSGGSKEAFSQFATAWGREEGFHLVLSQVLGGAATVAATPQPPVAAAEGVLSHAQVASTSSGHVRASTMDTVWGQEDDQLVATILEGSFLFETTKAPGNEQTEAYSSSDEEFIRAPKRYKAE